MPLSEEQEKANEDYVEHRINQRIGTVRAEVQQVKHAHDALAANVAEYAETLEALAKSLNEGSKRYEELTQTVLDLSKLVADLAARPN